MDRVKGCYPLKKIRQHYIRVGIGLLLFILLNSVNNISITEADPTGSQITSTWIFADHILITGSDSIFFTVYVTSVGNPVTGGIVEVYKANEPANKVSATISGGMAILEWSDLSTSGYEAWSMEAHYLGTSEYNSSESATTIYIEPNFTPGEDESQTTIVPDITDVYINDTVNFDIDIAIAAGAPFPMFDGYISLYDLSHNIVLWSEKIDSPAMYTYSTSAEFVIPSWYIYGNHTIEAQYSGSYNFASAAPSIGTCIIQSLSNTTDPGDQGSGDDPGGDNSTDNSTDIIYNTTISVDQEPIDATYGTILNIPVYITSSNGSTITDGEIVLTVFDQDIPILELTNNISQGNTNFELNMENFSEGSYQVTFYYAGNETQANATLETVINVSKGISTFITTIEDNTIEYGQTTHWSAFVTNELGNPIENIPISFETTLTGFYWDNWGTIMTDGDGYANIKIVWLDENQVHYGQPGSYTIRITIEENDFIVAQETTKPLQVTKNNVILTLEDRTITRLSNTIFEGYLTTSTGYPISNKNINLYWNGTASGSWIKLATVTTDTNGHYFYEKWIDLLPKIYGLEVSYAGSTYYTAASQTASLEVLNNPAEIEKIEITPTILDLGDIVEINVNITDIDSISSVSVFIYREGNNFTITLDYIDGTYQTTIWCDNQYTIGTWTINIITVDSIGLETTFPAIGQFLIEKNPAPEVSYELSDESIADGSTIMFTISATDTLGISSVTIEIDSTIYDITQNTSINNEYIGSYEENLEQRETRRIDILSNYLRARETSVFYFEYKPDGTGSISFTIYVEDNAGQIKNVSGYFMVEAIAPELFVNSLSILSGTAPYSFSLNVSVTDGSGINYVSLYANSQDIPLEYNIDNSYWETTTTFSAGTYILTIIAEDNVGTQQQKDLGTLIVNPSNFEIVYASEKLFDGESTNFTIQASESLANADVTIIHNNEEISLQLDVNASLTGEIQFTQAGTYNTQVIITDSLGTEIIKESQFNITLKSPEFQSVYPTPGTLITMHTPTTLNVETIVIDASGIQSVVLWLNDSVVPLLKNTGVWSTTIALQEASYTLKLVATDIYGAETIYNLGDIRPEDKLPPPDEPEPSSTSITSQTPKNQDDIAITLGMTFLTVGTVVGSVFVSRIKKARTASSTSNN